MPNWEPVYPERINWENTPSKATEIDEINLNKGDKALYEMDRRILSLGKSYEFILDPNNWNNYVYTIQTDFFEDDDHPIAQVWGTNTPETYDEISDRAKIQKILCTSTAITIYANSSSSPITQTLKLVIRR